MVLGNNGLFAKDATVHRLKTRYSNRLSCVVIDEARRTFEEDIVRVLEDIELAKRLKRVVAAALHLHWGLIAPTPRQPYSPPRRFEVAFLAEQKGLKPISVPVTLLVGLDLVALCTIVH